ncbi:MAG TPA: GH1 family beta-glucosidase [Ruminiclostridium sp.]|nr:GH1 family beta-glucosidase [Ruminiclostridium sp.]
MSFKEGFVWGTATAAYQIEGCVNEGGRGESVWDEFCRTKGNIDDGDSGDLACDSYHRFSEDIQLMKQIGVKAYRFSISWTRILPKGTGEINMEGVNYYNNLIDELLENGIEPYVTLFHWDYPMELQYKGGWLNPESPQWFANYAAICSGLFSDRVKYWVTSNESQCYIGFGLGTGWHAPGLKLPANQVVRAWHHNLKGLGLAAKAIRENAKGEVKVGLVSCGEVGIPASECEADIQAARNVLFDRETTEELNFGYGDLFDPAIKGRYPERLIPYLPKGWQDDMKDICVPLDFVGLNVYIGAVVKGSEKSKYEYQKLPVGIGKTSMEWAFKPESLYWVTRLIYERYNIPVYITENGMANNDWISTDGKINDTQREDYMNQYLSALSKSIDDGADVRGYFYWSLLDNFEWAYGYSKRFGLVYVDYSNYSRKLKQSALRYKSIIETNGEVLK